MNSETENGNVHRMTHGDRTIVLVGTAHVSLESAELVERVIAEEQPDTVCVELCRSRYQAIAEGSGWQETDLLKVIREKKASLLLVNLLLSHLQKRLGKQLGIKPGEEMVRAIQSAKTAGAAIHVADRDIRTTLTRAWRSIGLWDRLRLLAQIVVAAGRTDTIQPEDIEQMKRQDVLETLLAEMGEAFPEVARVLIDERDRYLAQRIRTAPGSRIVAVVGAGHVPGMKKYWDQPVDLAELEVVPPGGSLVKVVKWLIPALILGLIVWGFASSGTAVGTHMITAWVAANAVLAGLGAAAALARPLTVLSAVVAAPLTSLNPMIAAGWVSGLVEALLDKPKVRDFESLPEDISTFRGFWRNRITRILLVVVFTNIGSILGTFVAIPLMLKVFA